MALNQAALRALNPAAKPSEGTNGRAQSGFTRPARILVVDDQEPVRSMIGAALERLGHGVQFASSGQEAMAALERDAFDLVLTDIVVRDGNVIAHGCDPEELRSNTFRPLGIAGDNLVIPFVDDNECLIAEEKNP